MRLLPMFAAVVLMAGLPACTFVHMTPGASQVKVLAAAPTGCDRRGEVDVSVKDRLGPYERSESKVRDELETLARNEAPGLSADSISPLTPPMTASSAGRCGVADAESAPEA